MAKAGSSIISAPPDPRAVLEWLARRHSCRDFDGSGIDPAEIEAIIADGTEAPSSCNQQNWHFVVVSEPALKRRAHDIAGGNPHFLDCAVIIYLCFQKGWTHDKFSIVQSVAGACYHMILSAHLRGYATIWNAGIGDTEAIADLLAIPANFEIQGALCIGRAKPTAPGLKAPRRPVESVRSWNRFARPAVSLYPARPARRYPYFRIRNSDNPFAVWDPAAWGWARLGDFRGLAVWAKSPLAGVYHSRTHGQAIALEVGALPELGSGARLVELMPWGGSHSTALRRRYGLEVHLHLAELSPHNHTFILERIRREGLSTENVHADLIDGPRLPYGDATIDAILLAQTLEQMPEPEAMLAEVARVLKPGGSCVVSARNALSAFGWQWRRRLSREQIPNPGPYRPLLPWRLIGLLRPHFTLEESFGVSLAAAQDATRIEGPFRFVARLLVVRAQAP